MSSPLNVDNTDYLSLFWSGKDSLSVSNVIKQFDNQIHENISSPEFEKNKNHKSMKLKIHVNPKKPPPILPEITNKVLKPLPVIKMPKVLTQEEIDVRMTELSKPFVDKSENICELPKLCTDVINISSSCVDEIQERPKPGCFEFDPVPLDMTKLLLNIRATSDGLEEWENNPKQAFHDLLFRKNDHLNNVDVIDKNEINKMTNKLLYSKIDYKRTPKHVMEFHGFMHRYCLNFVCLVYDIHMRLIGSYDLQSINIIPGIIICPPNIEIHTAEVFRTSASLLAVDISLLPNHVFAVVPILYDEAGQCLPPLTISFRLNGNSAHKKDWRPVSERFESFLACRTQERTATFGQHTTRFKQVHFAA
jgi:hypothetical protein